MKRLLLFLLCFCLTGCTYLGATEDILINSPNEIQVSSYDLNEYTPEITSNAAPSMSTASDHPESTTKPSPETTVLKSTHLILNTSSKKIHYFESCSHVNRMNEKNSKVMPLSAEKSLLTEDYTVCSWCAGKRN
jgi:hypothetical protein